MALRTVPDRVTRHIKTAQPCLNFQGRKFFRFQCRHCGWGTVTHAQAGYIVHH